MKTYLVGGAVRDELLQRPVKDRDWVVVGATPQQMLAKGYQQVGKDFPVFLHPETGEEYALARTERKSGKGYRGFECYAAADVTLEQDLMRRDLTINAMAKDQQGVIIDPHNGQQDVQQRILRHVSPAFVEDPLRVLRVARFSARFGDYGFAIADDTQELMKTMTSQGELAHLVAERVWKEMQQALLAAQPRLFFEVLRDCGALAVILPELDNLYGVPNPAKWHPEIDSGLHTMMVLEQAAKLSDEGVVRFAALLHDLGKAVTPTDKLPSHPGHEEAGVPIINALCQRLKIPKDYQQLAVLVSRYHLHCHKARELTPSILLKVLQGVDAFRRPQRFEQFLLACEADARGRQGFEDSAYPQSDYLRESLQVVNALSPKAFVAEGLKGPEIQKRLYDGRIRQLKIWLKTKQSSK